jgi:uncharacterized membrane protein YhiD involved in acid resistance
MKGAIDAKKIGARQVAKNGLEKTVNSAGSGDLLGAAAGVATAVGAGIQVFIKRLTDKLFKSKDRKEKAELQVYIDEAEKALIIAQEDIQKQKRLYEELREEVEGMEMAFESAIEQQTQKKQSNSLKR